MRHVLAGAADGMAGSGAAGVGAGDGVAAEKELPGYLESAGQHLLAAYRAAHG